MKHLLSLIATLLLSATLLAQGYKGHLRGEVQTVGLSMYADGNFTNSSRIPDMALQASLLWMDFSSNAHQCFIHFGVVVPLFSDYVNVIPLYGQAQWNATGETSHDIGFILQGEVPLSPRGLSFTTSYEHTNKLNAWLFGLKYNFLKQ